jgi:hypothetical protein
MDEDFHESPTHPESELDNPFPKPVYSYSCLIALALKNSKTGTLPVNEIYNFMTENFPYFKTAPDGWKNSVRNNLSLNKCFEKIEKPGLNAEISRKGCLWSLNPQKLGRMEEEIIKWRKKDPQGVLKSMSHPEYSDHIVQGIISSETLEPLLQFRLLIRTLCVDQIRSLSSNSTDLPSIDWWDTDLCPWTPKEWYPRVGLGKYI